MKFISAFISSIISMFLIANFSPSLADGNNLASTSESIPYVMGMKLEPPIIFPHRTVLDGAFIGYESDGAVIDYWASTSINYKSAIAFYSKKYGAYNAKTYKNNFRIPGWSINFRGKVAGDIRLVVVVQRTEPIFIKEGFIPAKYANCVLIEIVTPVPNRYVIPFFKNNSQMYVPMPH